MENPLHKQSEKDCMCFNTRRARTCDYTVYELSLGCLVKRGRKARLFMCHAQFLLFILCRLKLHNCKLLMKLFLPNFSVYAAHMTIFLYHTQSHVAWQFCNKLVEFFAATFGTITYYYYFFLSYGSRLTVAYVCTV